MRTMQEYADEFAKKHRGSGTVTDVNDYSFKYTTLEDNNGRSNTVTYMISYFYTR